jgi:hypothetical protein
MNCRACGTPLPEGAAHCPWCGAAISYYFATTAAAPDDPTVASSPDTAAPPLPSNVSGSSPYQNPYESYQVTPLAPPPPSPQRRGKRKGTATGVSSTTTQVVQDGSNKISRITEQWVAYGGIMGSFTVEETSLLHPDHTATSSGRVTCTCTVAGKSGTLMWSFTDMGTADGSYQGQFFNFYGTGDLAKLHGQGTFQGKGSHATYSTELYFDT